jgi:hypothetical protein
MPLFQQCKQVALVGMLSPMGARRAKRMSEGKLSHIMLCCNRSTSVYENVMAVNRV